MWTDSHFHLDTFVADESWPACRERALKANVNRMIAIGGTGAANKLAMDYAGSDAALKAVLGYDRDEAGRNPDINLLREQLKTPGVVGVGETGLDYHYSADTATAQCALLEAMLDLACQTRLPVVIHTREAEDDTVNALRAYAQKWSGPSDVPGIIHCYTGGPAFARSLLDLGFMISFSGIVTFKNAALIRDALKVVPDDRLLIETDAPYLAPVPYRGKRNEPAFVREVGQFVAEYLERPPEEVARITSANAARVFGVMENAL